MVASRSLLPCLLALAVVHTAPAPPHAPSSVEISGSVLEIQRAFQDGVRSVTQSIYALLTDEQTAVSQNTLKDNISKLRNSVVSGITKLNQSICWVDPPTAPDAIRASLKKLEESFNDGVENLNFGADILTSLRSDKDNDKDKDKDKEKEGAPSSGQGGNAGVGETGNGPDSGDKGPFYFIQNFFNEWQQSMQNNINSVNSTLQNYFNQISGQGNNGSNSQSSGDSNQNPFIHGFQQFGQQIQNVLGGGQQQQQQQQGQQQQQQQQQQQSDDQSSTTQRPFWQSISQGFQNSINNIFRPGASAQAPATAAATTPVADSTSSTAPAQVAQQATEQTAPPAPPAGSDRHKGGWGGSNNNAAIGDNRGGGSSGLEEEKEKQPTEESSNKPVLVESKPQSVPEHPVKSSSEPELQSAPEPPSKVDSEPESQSVSQPESNPTSQSNTQEEQKPTETKTGSNGNSLSDVKLD